MFLQPPTIKSPEENNESPDIRAFIESVIKIRKVLLRNDLNRKNGRIMQDHLERLERYLNFYPNISQMNLARFFLHNQEIILEIMPGKGSNCYQAKYDEFKMIYEKCLSLSNGNKWKLLP